MLYEFLAGYIALLATSLMAGGRQMGRTSLAMFGNWAVNTAFVSATGLYSPWFWFACVDFATAAIILKNPAGKWQSAIGWVYIAQIVLHFTYWWAANPDAEYEYWLWLTRLAWAQIGLVVLWGGSGGARRAYNHWFRRGARNPVHPRVGSLGK